MAASPDLVRKVIDANIAVHSKLAAQYEACEPHFRPENVAKVERRIASLVAATKAQSALDLGCGTGFMVQILKKLVSHITGVDVTSAMLDRVDRSGTARMDLVQHDTGTYPVEPGAFQLVTAYSFLHHLCDLAPTLGTAARALGPGGKFYADLEPNYYFWEVINRLERGGAYHPLVQREIEAVTFKDEEIEERFGVSRDTFNHAEFGKDIAGGFKQEELQRLLREAGFSQVEFYYDWFLGEGFMINREGAPREERFRHAEIVNESLQSALPASRNLFKYLGFVATK